MGHKVAVDFDGSIATYYHGQFPMVGEPIMPMVNRVKKMLREGKEVVIFSARFSEKDPDELEEQIELVQNWCLEHLGQKLPCTAVKTYDIVEFYDDRAKQLIPNKGILVEELKDYGSQSCNCCCSEEQY